MIFADQSTLVAYQGPGPHLRGHRPDLAARRRDLSALRAARDGDAADVRRRPVCAADAAGCVLRDAGSERRGPRGARCHAAQLARDRQSDNFESEKVKIWLLRLVSENLQLPDELGTGFGMFLMPGLMHGFGVSQPVGGSGKLSPKRWCAASSTMAARCAAMPKSPGPDVGRPRQRSGALGGEQFNARDAVIGAIHPHVLRKFVAGVPEPAGSGPSARRWPPSASW
jgi:hypothetical protein